MQRLNRSITRRISAPLVVLFVLSLLFTGHTAYAQDETGQSAKRVIGYFSAWNVYDRNYRIKDIHTSGIADTLTHLNYAFGNVAPVSAGGQIKCLMYDTYADYQKTFTAEQSIDGVAVSSGALRGNLQQLKQLKKLYPELKIMISLGGWTLSDYFSDMLTTATSRTAFVNSCVDLWLKGNLPVADGAGGARVGAGIFDGIDIDWEFPGTCGKACQEDGLAAPGGCVAGTTHCVSRPTADPARFTQLLQTFRTALNTAGQGRAEPYLLTAATSSNPKDYSKLQLGQIHQYLDFINVMSYDLHGTWESTTNFNAPLMPTPSDPTAAMHLTVSEALQGYLAGGIPASKLVMGVPFYGRGWKNTQTTGNENPLYKATSVNDHAAPGTWQAGIDDFKVLRAKYRAGKYLRYYNTTAKNAYLYNPTTKIFWTYDDAQTMQEKARYVMQHNLGGVMIWEISGDSVTGELSKAIYNELNK